MKIDLKQGDCLILMNDIEDKSIDLILCDLPYNTTYANWDNNINSKLLWKHYKRIIKDNGVICLFSVQPFTTYLINSNLKHFRYCWYWYKNNVTGFQYAKFQPMRQIEEICVFYKKSGSYYPQGVKDCKKNSTRKKNECTLYKKTLSNFEYIQTKTNYPKNVLRFDKDKENFHPTQKPIKLLEYLIKTYTNENDIVLDNCMGSGSTGIACINTNRNFIGYELNNNFFEIAKKRINYHMSNFSIKLI